MTQQSVEDLVARLERERSEADRLYNEALTAVDRAIQSLVRFESLLVQYLQTITTYIDTRDRTLGSSDVRERLAIAEQRLIALKRDVQRVPAAREEDAAPAAASTSAAEAATYVGFEDRFRGSQQEIRRRVEDYVPILSTASDVVDVGCGRGELLDLLKQR